MTTTATTTTMMMTTRADVIAKPESVSGESLWNLCFNGIDLRSPSPRGDGYHSREVQITRDRGRRVQTVARAATNMATLRIPAVRGPGDIAGQPGGDDVEMLFYVLGPLSPRSFWSRAISTSSHPQMRITYMICLSLIGQDIGTERRQEDLCEGFADARTASVEMPRSFDSLRSCVCRNHDPWIMGGLDFAKEEPQLPRRATRSMSRPTSAVYLTGDRGLPETQPALRLVDDDFHAPSTTDSANGKEGMHANVANFFLLLAQRNEACLGLARWSFDKLALLPGLPCWTTR
ncbi:hypothetical protein M406DRAFT_68054 [Cryphonectria parasitica EP155]|uniref:Uncharacterized protein n=1 Tax=Cryphonectria parasitica (strain ATCC 38755 / EP155) TaxID=660469 RepID=A0A9P4Y3U1_CRYP1|nr:uncharacterized protein M406DRAFT_68054 [Cryphonectria parasitica EP155]KAF3765630.1 hypothetical protein M406DRAFT_68054 [Cryphonectria parasitica EP155]